MSKTRRPLSPDEILNELDRLVKLKTIALPSLDIPAFESSYEPIERFVNDLRSSGKPETQVHNLFNRLLEDVLQKSAVPEANIGVGFVDYSLQEEHSNPVLIELKPLFFLDSDSGALHADPVRLIQHEKQVTKYLRKNDYVLLSDLRSAYLFNRDAFGEYKPFHEESLVGLLRRFRESENVWDAIRRVEDQSFRPDLDTHFFDDLKKWHGEFQSIKMLPPEGRTKSELIVLLLNKVIFIKTLEDYGLIDFHYLVDTYELYRDRWEERDLLRFVERFFDEVEEFFKVYYNTELFKLKFWDYVVKDKENVAKFKDVFERMLGTGRWEKEFAQGLTHYTYRQIDEDVFGKAYETFIAEHRKDSGVYYTPKSITVYMARKIVDDLFRPIVDQILVALDKDQPNIDTANELMESLYNLKVLDPTSGSGSFLIKVLREIDAQYQRITSHTDWVQNIHADSLADLPKVYGVTTKFREEHKLGANNRLTLIGQMLLRHIHAIDIDERALDTAKTNTWKEAIKLRPRIYNYRRFRKAQIDHILPDLELNYLTGDSLADLPIDRQIEILNAGHQSEIARLHQIRKEYIADPFKPETIDEALEIKRQLRAVLSQEIPEIERPALIAMEFFFAYFNEDGSPLPESERGFDGVISNPPWEAVKPVQKEYAKIPKGSQDILNFSDYFKERLKTDETFRKGWKDYQDFYSRYTDYLFSRYTHQGKGDPNYYKFFLERDLELIRQDGHLAILVPSGFQTDVGCKPLRELAIFKNSFEEIASFENRGYETVIKEKPKRVKLFPEVHPQFKFSILLIQKRKPKKKSTFDGRFYLQQPSDLENITPLKYSPAEIEKFSPVNLGIMEFRSEDDARICRKIRDEHPLIKDLDFKFYTEIHMTNGKDLFIAATNKDSKKSSSLALFEGKMIHQYRADFDSPRFFIDREAGETEVRRKLAARVKRLAKLETEPNPASLKIDLDEFRLGIRDIGASTNERSIIALLLPRNVFVGNTINYLINYRFSENKGKLSQQLIPRDDLLFTLAILNSLTLNFYIRNKISSHVSISFLYEMPIPNAAKDIRSLTIDLSRQIVLANDSQNYFKELGKKPAKTFNIVEARAELEVLIARDLYGLSLSDWTYLTSTFTQGGDSESRIELLSIIKASTEMFSKD